jgi:hypothetical protein
MGGVRTAYKIVTEKTEEKKLFAIGKCKWEVNVEMDFKGIGYEGVHWICCIRPGDGLL